MIREKIEQYEIIEEQDAAAFQERLNSAMQKHKTASPTCRMEIAGPTWRAVVTYEEEDFMPENLADDFEIQGKLYTCGDCPYFKKPTDKRIRKVYCSEDGRVKIAREEKPACEWLLDQIQKGEVKI